MCCIANSCPEIFFHAPLHTANWKSLDSKALNERVCTSIYEVWDTLYQWVSSSEEQFLLVQREEDNLPW